MRIGIYDPYLDDLGGGEKYMMSIAQILAENHTVDVFWDKKEDIDSLLERFRLDLSRVKQVKNIFSPTYPFLKKLLATRKYDAIIFLSDGSVPLSISKKLFLHIQQPLHTVEGSFWGNVKLSRVTRIFCNSNFTKSFVDKHLQEKTEVIYPPVALHPRKVKKTNTILHVGRFRVKNIAIEDYKKQGIMVQTFIEMIKKGLKNWKFVLAVSVMDKDKEAFQTMKNAAKGFPIEFSVNKTNDQLWELYSQAKIYWHASGFGEDLSLHPEYAEHFGISTVEAMGAGAVPVVINAGGQKEIVANGKNGLLWKTLDELQEQTLRLIKSPKILQKLSSEARKRAQDFSYEKFSEAVHTLIA